MYTHILSTRIFVYTSTCCVVCIHTLFCVYTRFRFRDANESDTDSTDDGRTWGGLGAFEYARKGLPHALVHARELVETGGHHGAYCSSLSEMAHKRSIKLAAKLSKTCGSFNVTHENMLEWELRQRNYDAILDRFMTPERRPRRPLSDDEDDEGKSPHTPVSPLHYTTHWPDPTGLELSNRWVKTFISKQVLITRGEFLLGLRHKLEMDEHEWSLMRLYQTLQFRCFGSLLTVTADGAKRKITGVGKGLSRNRRDFVKLRGNESGTSYAAQVWTHTHTRDCNVYIRAFGYVYKMFVYTHICVYTKNIQVYTDDCDICLYTHIFVCIHTLGPHVCGGRRSRWNSLRFARSSTNASRQR